MSNYVIITLDTTPPTINIIAPRYTTHEIINEIMIVANEPISSNQEIYVIDSNGEKHDYNFKRDGNGLIGYVRFNNLPIGIATMYARVEDEVGNMSNLAQHSIFIRESSMLLKLSIEDLCAKNNIAETTRIVNVKDYQRDSAVKDYQRDSAVKDYQRKNIIKEYKR